MRDSLYLSFAALKDFARTEQYSPRTRQNPRFLAPGAVKNRRRPNNRKAARRYRQRKMPRHRLEGGAFRGVPRKGGRTPARCELPYYIYLVSAATPYLPDYAGGSVHRCTCANRPGITPGCIGQDTDATFAGAAWVHRITCARRWPWGLARTKPAGSRSEQSEYG